MTEIELRYYYRRLNGEVYFKQFSINGIENGYTETEDGTIIARCLFTGCLDDKGLKIFDGDIIRMRYTDQEDYAYFVIKFEQGKFIAYNEKNDIIFDIYRLKPVSIIGNIYIEVHNENN